MSDLYDRIGESVAALKARGVSSVDVLLVFGSRTGSIDLEDRREIDWRSIPHFPQREDGEPPRLSLGRFAGASIALLEDRPSYHEGHTMAALAQPLRALSALGARVLIQTSSAGALDPRLAEGDLVAVGDHINLMGDNPLIGPNDERLGPRFPDMSAPYDGELLALAESVARKQGLALERGILAALAGPNLETVSEAAFLREVGADLVCQSMVPETLSAVHLGLRVFSLAVVTDQAGIAMTDPGGVEEIRKVAAAAAPRVRRLIEEMLTALMTEASSDE